MFFNLKINEKDRTFTWQFKGGTWRTHHKGYSEYVFYSEQFDMFEDILKDIETICIEILHTKFNLKVAHEYAYGFTSYEINGKLFEVNWGECYECPHTSNVWLDDLQQFLYDDLGIALDVSFI